MLQIYALPAPRMLLHRHQIVSTITALILSIEGRDVLQFGSPESVGMLPQPLRDMASNISAYLQYPIEPGSTTLVARDGVIVSAVAVGERYRYADSNGTLLASGERLPAELDTIYDMASLTKLFTSTAVLREFDRGNIDLNATVSSYLPEFAVNGKENITIIRLLTHTSGLPPDPTPDLFSANFTTAQQRFEAIVNSSLQAMPGTEFIYSDINFMTLRFVLERVTGRPYEDLVYSFTIPLGMASTFFNRGNIEGPKNGFYWRTAPTEYQIEVLGPSEPRRPQPVHGTVHDENAWALDGISGHAGLFSTVLDSAVFAHMINNNGTYAGRRYLSQTAVDLIFTDFNANFPGNNYGAGWALNQSYSQGSMQSIRTASHTGFTGTTLAIDRPSHTIFLHFSNRVHPNRNWDSSNPIRRAVGYWVAKSLGRDVRWPN